MLVTNPDDDPLSGTIELTIDDNRFVDPDGGVNQNATIRITAGSTVRWTYVGAGGSVHTVSSGEGAGGLAGDGVPDGASVFDSGNLAPGETFSVTLSVPGTYTYFCRIHPNTMFGATIEVV